MSHKNLFLVSLCVLTTSAALAQTSNTYPWPSSGSIAVGTTTPTAGAKMDVDGSIRLVGEGYPAAAAAGDGGAWLINEAGVGLAVQAGGSIRLRTGANTTDRIVVTTAGNVGIGIPPSVPLDVNGKIRSRVNNDFGLQFNKSNGDPGDVAGLDANNALILKGVGGGVIFRDSTNASDRLTIGDNGNVGLGITLPASAFHLSRTVATPTDYLMRIDNKVASGSDPAMIITYTGGKSLLSLAGTGGGALATDGTLYFATGSDLNVNSFSGIRMSINTAGTVSIAAPTSGYALDVNGTIHASQVIGATYQDVAEWVPATAKMSPGTVVVVQRGATNTVMPSATEYATSVAGVVSEKPGLILGESSDSKAMIATTGRVKVHVDASSGAIEAGDLLVTSGKPGMAMKSQPVDLGGVKIHRPGTLIGKALESLPRGEGDILVLLSLQ